MSGADPMGDNGRQARTGRMDGREHVPGANMSGANLTPFFSKNTPKLPFLAKVAQMNFF
jgi:hypothetical protein